MIEPCGQWLEDLGSVVGWFEGGGLVRSSAHGSTSHDGAPLGAATTFDAASLSKPVVARWVIELALQGELDLEAPIELDPRHVNAAPDPRLRAITPAMALSHCTGFPNWRPPGQPLRLLAEPGMRIIYSGEGFEYLLAALRLERGANRVEQELEELLARLDMGDSSFVRVRGEEAVGHLASGECTAPALRRCVRAAGSLHTSLRDYARFLAASLAPAEGGDLRREVRRLMANVYIRNGEDARTIGWAHVMTRTGPLLWQNGDNPGFKHLAAIYPDSCTGVIVLTNSDRGIVLVRQVGEELGVPARHHDGYRTK